MNGKLGSVSLDSCLPTVFTRERCFLKLMCTVTCNDLLLRYNITSKPVQTDDST